MAHLRLNAVMLRQNGGGSRVGQAHSHARSPLNRSGPVKWNATHTQTKYARHDSAQLDNLRSEASRLAKRSKVDWSVERTDKGRVLFFEDLEAKTGSSRFVKTTACSTWTAHLVLTRDSQQLLQRFLQWREKAKTPEASQ